jgi:hypothetical protein
MALKGKKPRKALGLNPTMVRGHTLQPAEAQERIVRFLKWFQGSYGEGLEGVENI